MNPDQVLLLIARLLFSIFSLRSVESVGTAHESVRGQRQAKSLNCPQLAGHWNWRKK
jgi:hypothetical protein